MRHWWKLAAAASTLALTLTVASVALANPPDAWITARVKIALMTDKDVRARDVNVDTQDGRVTLHGKVGSTLERRVASQVAARIDGVRGVNNVLQVVPRDERREVHAADNRIRDRVRDALKNDPELAHSNIHVASVDRGVVLLAGRANSSGEHLRALQVASRVPGVRRTASEVQMPDVNHDPGYANRDRDREYYGYDRGRGMRNERDMRNDHMRNDRTYGARTYDRRNDNEGRGGFSDAWITAKTKMKFATDAAVPATKINVDTDDGVVTLFGTVPSQASAQQAVRLAHSVNGVRGVHNELVVVPREDRKQVMGDDRQVTSRIKNRFDRANFRESNIHVDVRAGVARLTGTYARDRDHYDALMLARSTPGVLYVQDDMRPDENRAGNE